MRYWLTMVIIGSVLLPLVVIGSEKILGFEFHPSFYVGFVLSVLGIVMDRQDRIMEVLKGDRP